MAGDSETVTAAAAVAVTAGGDLVPRPGARPPGPAAIAAELLARTRAELPVLAGLGEREELLAAAWLASQRAARTRRAYAGDVRGWLGWLAERGTDVLDAGRVHVDVWAAAQQDRGAESSTVRRRLSALSSFDRYCAAHDLADRIPTAGVARPAVDPDYTATIGLACDQARALVAAADTDRGPQALRTAAVIRLLLHNALRVDEACAADVTALGADAGHRVLRVTRKGARRPKVPLAPATVAALDAYLVDRARRGGPGHARQLPGPLLATASGGRLRQGHLWELVRRLARDAGIQAWNQLSPHCLRPSAITFALDAGTTLHDVQDYAGHKDPRTTRRYDHGRDAWTATPPTRSQPTSPDRDTLPAALRGPAAFTASSRSITASRPELGAAVSASRPAGLADLSGLSDLVARRHGQRRGFDVIKHRQLGGDRCIRAREW